MTINKILLVDFVSKKVTGAYEGESQQVFTVLSPERIEAVKRTTEAIDRVNYIISKLKKGKEEDGN